MPNYIVDTSVILSDVNDLLLLSQNNTNKIYLPDIVIEEIDLKKKGFKDSSYQARKFNRMLDSATITKDKIIKGLEFNKVEAKIHDKDITFYIVKKTEEAEFSSYLLTDYINILNDKRIVSVSKKLKEVFKKEDFILVTNDAGLRNRAIIEDVKSEPILRDRKQNIDSLELIKEIKISVEQSKNINNLKLDDLVELNGEIKISNFTNIEFQVIDSNRTILAFWKQNSFYQLDEKKLNSFAVQPQNKEQRFFLNMLLDKDVSVIVAAGSSGSGKNLLALLGGLEYETIKYARNTVAAGDEVAQLGFLKGDEDKKLGVFTYPLFDSVRTLLELQQNKSKFKGEPISFESERGFVEEHNIEVININQMRGVNLSGYMILDEWQNSSKSVTKLMLTRIKEGSKVVIIGDVNQIDHPHLSKYNNGLSIMLNFAKDNDFVAGVVLKKVLRGSIASFAEANL